MGEPQRAGQGHSVHTVQHHNGVRFTEHWHRGQRVAGRNPAQKLPQACRVEPRPTGTRSATTGTSTASDSSQRHVGAPARPGSRPYSANKAAGTSTNAGSIELTAGSSRKMAAEAQGGAPSQNAQGRVQVRCPQRFASSFQASVIPEIATIDVNLRHHSRIVQKVRRERRTEGFGSSVLQKKMRVGPSMSAGRGRHQTRQCGWGSKGLGRERLLKSQH
jgi:hypothetical protein